MTTQRACLFPISRRRRILTSAGLLGVIVAAGGLLTWWAVARADREMREDLLQQAQQVAQAMNADRIQMLSGTAADIDNPAYTRVKSQLISVRSVYPQCRFLYLMGRRTDGHLFLFMDSEPADSKDYSPPGQIYDKASAACRYVFATHTAVSDGLETDRWGTWVSALVPIGLRDRFALELGPGVATCGRLRMHRAGMLQMIGNLLANAAEAIGESGKDQGTVFADASVQEAEGCSMIHLCVRDDGAGIAADNLDRVFERGFTTKAGLARGMGLHWCANTVMAMDGRMYAESDGVGQGACLHVLLPKNA